MGWEPIFDRGRAGVRDRGAPSATANLAAGAAGQAIMLDYLARTGTPSGSAHAALETALAALADEPLSASLFHGFTGIAWAGVRLARDELDLDEIDDALAAALAPPWRGPVGLLDGLAGIGVYALERLPDPRGRELLAAVVDRACEAAVDKPTGKTFWTPPDHDEPHGAYLTGAARGIAGVIAMLAGACAWDVATDRARPLLAAAVAWLRVAVLPDGSAARYPTGWRPQREATPSRIAWCDGDPGIAAALMVAARAVGEPEWEAEALALALHAARRPADTIDVGVCHGAAGLCHVFNRLYQATGHATLRTTAIEWLERAIATRDLERTPGLLVGDAGIDLVLAAATSDIEPAWDRALLLSLHLPPK